MMSEEGSTDHLQDENQRLRHAVFSLVNDKQRAARKLVGIQNLGEQLQERDEEIRGLKEKLERLQDTLARAENRIAQLNLQLGDGPQKAIVTPGVSKKVLEALTRENTKLRLSLDHLANKIPNGTDLAVENRELHELIMAQRNELLHKANELADIKAALDATQDKNMATLHDQIKRLTVQETKLDRQLNAKQAFCETLVTENERLKEVVQTVKNERITEMGTLRKQLGRVMQSSPDIKRIMEQVAFDNEDGFQNDAAMKELEEVTSQLTESKALLHDKEEDYVKLQELCKTLETQLNEKEDQLENAEKTINKYRSWEQELKRRELDEVVQLRRVLEEKTAEIKCIKEEQKMMQDSLKDYENDWKTEKKEKDQLKTEKERMFMQAKEVNQKYDQLKWQHESLKQSMYSQQQPKQQKIPSPPPLSPPGQQSRRQFVPQSCASQMKQPWQQYQNFGREVVADGAGIEQADSASQHQLPPKPAPRRIPCSSEIECPVCGQFISHDLIEAHMRDCLGD